MRFMTTVGLTLVGTLVLAVLLMGLVPGQTPPAGVEMGAAIAPMAAATAAPQPNPNIAAPQPNPNIAAPQPNPNIAAPQPNPNIASDPETNPNIAGDTTALLMAAAVLLLSVLGLSATLLRRQRSLRPQGQALGSMAR